jgi:Zinc finger, C2H2 type
MCRPQIHPCFYCGLRLPTLGEVRTHVKKKHEDINFECAFVKCGTYFWSEADKISHMTKVHGTINIPCNFCGQTFTRNINLREHIAQSHPTDLDFQCPERNCMSFAKSASDLESHLTIFHDYCNAKRVLHCVRCKFTTKSKRRLTFHLLTTHLNKPFKCQLCTKKYKTSSDLKKHQSKMHQNKITCLHCKKDVGTNRMKFHLKTPRCEICGGMFSCYGLLYHHSASCRKKRACTSNAERGKYLEARFMGEQLAVVNFENTLKPSEQENDNPTEFESKLTIQKSPCRQGPQNDHNYHRPIGNIHNIDKMKILCMPIISGLSYSALKKAQTIECYLCGKVLKQKYGMITHLLATHRIGKAAFECKKCSKLFYLNYEYQRHVMRCKTSYLEPNHSTGRGIARTAKAKANSSIIKNGSNKSMPNVKSHHSDQTEKKTKTFSMQKVSGLSSSDYRKVQNIECALCGDIFHRKDNMIIHLLGVHGIGKGKFKCKKCNKSFYYNSDFQRHVRTICKTSSLQRKLKPSGQKSKETAAVSLSTNQNFGDEHSSNIIDGVSIGDLYKGQNILCPFCNKILRSKFQLVTHLQVVHGIGKRTFECTNCSKSFYAECDFQNHAIICKTSCSQPIRSEKRRMAQTAMAKSTIINSGRNKNTPHVAHRHPEKTGKRRKRSKMQIISGLLSGDCYKVQSIKCALCNNVVHRKASMIIHLLRVHGIGKSSFECKKCNKLFYFYSAFHRHAKSHL